MCKKKVNKKLRTQKTCGCACAAPAVRPAELRHGSRYALRHCCFWDTDRFYRRVIFRLVLK